MIFSWVEFSIIFWDICVINCCIFECGIMEFLCSLLHCVFNWFFSSNSLWIGSLLLKSDVVYTVFVLQHFRLGLVTILPLVGSLVQLILALSSFIKTYANVNFCLTRTKWKYSLSLRLALFVLTFYITILAVVYSNIHHQLSG